MLAGIFTERGGELVTRSRVKRILIENRAVKGVMLEDERVINADSVISNADGRQTINELAGSEHFGASMTEYLANAESSPSLFKVSLGVCLKTPHAAPSILCYPSYDIESMMEATEKNALSDTGFIWIFIPSLVDSSLAPEGKHLIEIHMTGDYYKTVCNMTGTEYEAFRQKVEDSLIRRAEKVINGLSAHIDLCDTATPLTIQSFTLNSSGAMYGWNLTPDGLLRTLSQETSVKGLYLAGHWTFPGGGVGNVMLSGSLAAQTLMCRNQ
ncbi:MAG: phytoene desaturase family protein [Vulcanimicrobiota bacterium]